MIDKNTLDNYNKHLSKKDSEYRAKRKANVGMYLGMAKEFAPKSLGSADELVASKIKQQQKSSDWWNTSPNERKARGYAKGGKLGKNKPYNVDVYFEDKQGNEYSEDRIDVVAKSKAEIKENINKVVSKRRGVDLTDKKHKKVRVVITELSLDEVGWEQADADAHKSIEDYAKGGKFYDDGSPIENLKFYFDGEPIPKNVAFSLPKKNYNVDLSILADKSATTKEIIDKAKVEVEIYMKNGYYDTINYSELNDITNGGAEEYDWGFYVYPETEEQLMDVLKSLNVSVSKERLADIIDMKKDVKFEKGGKTFETKNDLYNSGDYDNLNSLSADIIKYFNKLEKDISKGYADEMRSELIKDIKNPKQFYEKGGITKDELMEHYDFYVEDEEENGNIPLNYDEWYGEFGEEIEYQIKNIFAKGGTIIKKGNRVRVVNTKNDGKEGVVVSNLLNGSYLLNLDNGKTPIVSFDNLMLLSRETYAKGGKTKTIKRSGKWGKNYSELCSELATYKDGGSLWIETDKEPPVNEGAFVGEAEKRNMSVKELMNKALKYPTREDFDSDGEYETYADSKKGKKEIKLRKQAQMVKNMGNYAKGGEVVEVRYRGLPIKESMLGKPVMSEQTTDRLEDEFGQDLTFTPIEETKMKPLSYQDGRKFIVDFDRNFKGLLKGYAKGGYLEGKTYYIVNYYSSVSDIPKGIPLKNKSFDTKEVANTFLKSIENKGGRGFITDFRKPTQDEISKLDRDRNENYMMAKGGDTSEYEVKSVVNGNNGSWTLEEYQNLPNKDWMGKEPLSLERTIEKVFELNDEAMDYEDEIREAEDVDALGEILKDNDLVEGFNTYNNSWWGGTRQYYILKNWDDKLDLDYETIVFLSFHRGGDVRGNYEKFEAFEIDAYGYEDFPVYSDRLSYVITKGDKSATFDTEDEEGYSLYTIEDDFGKFEVDDSTDIDKVSEEFNVSLY